MGRGARGRIAPRDALYTSKKKGSDSISDFFFTKIHIPGCFEYIYKNGHTAYTNAWKRSKDNQIEASKVFISFVVMNNTYS